ncbi:MAG TPA: hypothetical protein VN426_12970 [Syntrophomonadaceae bacterium]|nr:hypothetical protein [Syntrophomonadaceae bacterium]
MNLLNKEAFITLMNIKADPCVTIYSPTYRAGVQMKQGPIRLKNLYREAEVRLLNKGLRTSEAKFFLKPVQDLIDDRKFWQHQRDSLAIFLSSDIFYHFRLPLHCNELVQMGQRFHLKPLLPLLSGDGRFYVLALSQNRVRVLRCTRASVEELALDSIPHSLAEALQFDDPERQLQFHSNTLEGTNSKAAAIFHGQGVGTDDSKDNILRYFRLIDRGLHDILKEERAPLVLMAVDFLIPIYRDANNYAYLSDEAIPGNPEELSAEDLQTLAWPLVEHYFHKAEQEALTYYGPFQGTGRTTHDIQEAAPAAYNGQVEILFLADGAEQWGCFDPDANGVQLHPQAEPGDEDLYDFAAMQTIMNGGSVYVMDPEKIPSGQELAALFRY